MITIDEEIKKYERHAYTMRLAASPKMEEEYMQIVEWLKELKELKSPTATLSESIDGAINELELAVTLAEMNNSLAGNMKEEFQINKLLIKKYNRHIGWLKELKAYRETYPYGVDGYPPEGRK